LDITSANKRLSCVSLVTSSEPAPHSMYYDSRHSLLYYIISTSAFYPLQHPHVCRSASPHFSPGRRHRSNVCVSNA